MNSASSASSSSALSNSTSVAVTAAAYAHHQQQHGRATSLSSIASIKQFPEIQLTLEEQAHYDRVVGRLLYRTVQEYSRYVVNGVVDRNAWTPVRSNHNMAIYRGQKGLTDNPLVSRILGVGKLDGKLEDVLDGLYADTSSELRKVMTLHESKCTIAKVFHVSETRSPERPFAFAGIKWFASKMPGSGVTTNDRDLLYYERQGLTFDTEGNEIAYHLIQSIDRPEWPANTFKHLIRSHSSVCYLHKRKGNRVETFCWGDFYGSGSIPQLVANYAIAGKLMSVKNALKCSEAKKLSQLRESANTRSSTSSITISEM